MRYILTIILGLFVSNSYGLDLESCKFFAGEAKDMKLKKIRGVPFEKVVDFYSIVDDEQARVGLLKIAANVYYDSSGLTPDDVYNINLAACIKNIK